MPTRTTTIAMRKTTGTYESCHARSVMSLPWGSEPGITLLVPVTTVEQAAPAPAPEARTVDAADARGPVPGAGRGPEWPGRSSAAGGRAGRCAAWASTAGRALEVQALAVVGRTDDLDHLFGIIDHLDQ